ncbi:hypothetical protein [Acanthopleuribacter pedis]|uniref:Calcium-binding protein n=1 Tax=Acanthopleuribacter pedis TaxID=442870 RepID=A0A8J7U439_9BACT|nr:hypothetical protein [Acanthopleuribacter pedis]MBO1320237.1 hypothetical protein [Acanthopleuribacter pedis]
MKRFLIAALLFSPFFVSAKWEQAHAYISRASDKCVYTGVVYSQYTTSFGAICSTISRTIDFNSAQHCPQNQWVVVSVTLRATARSTNFNPAQGTTLHLSGLTSGDGGKSIRHDKWETVDCSDCEENKRKADRPQRALPSDCDNSSPIIIDLAQDGLGLGGAENPVSFWIWPQHAFRQVMNWLQPEVDDAFLALDLNQNGMIDNGGELFGDGTFLALENDYAENGLLALAQHDAVALGGNNDGILTAEDAVWTHLLLWFDQDADGISQPEELVPLTETEITEWRLVATETRDFDHHGNWLRFRGTAASHTKTFAWVDVYFKRHPKLEAPGRLERGNLITD